MDTHMDRRAQTVFGMLLKLSCGYGLISMIFM